MNYGSLVPSFYFYKFAESISQSYTSFAAYRAGAIDANGNLLKPESSIDPYEYFVIKLKKIFEQLPPGLTKYQLANYTSALNYFAEEAEKFNIEKEHYIALVEGLLAAQCGPDASYIELLEDMSAGGMAVAGDSPAYNTGGVSGFDPVMAPMQRRKQVADDMYHMFDVSADDFSKISNNQMKEIEYLRRFGIRNPDATLIVRNSKDGKLYTVPKRKTFKEEYGLEGLDILIEEYHTGTEGHHIGHAISSLLDTIDDNEKERKSGSGSKNINAYATEYHGRGQLMLQGFKDASMHGGDHTQKWIDLSMTVAGKRASQKDTDPDKAPDAWHYDATVKDSDFAKRVRKVDIGTDRKFGEIYVGKEVKDSTLEKVLGIGREILDKDLFKKAVRERSQSAETRKALAPQMAQSSPWMILHRQDTSNRGIHTGDRFVMHEPEQLNPFLTSLQYNWSPSWGGKKQRSGGGQIEARPAIQSTDLRLRTTQHPNKPELGDFGAGYDILRTNKNSEEPKQAYTVESESLDHAMDHIPDDYTDQRGRTKQDIHAALLKMYSTSPHVPKGKTEGAPAKFTERGQLPLIIPPKQ